MEIKQLKPFSSKTKIITTAICSVLLLACLYCQIFVFPWGNSDLIGALTVLCMMIIIAMWFMLGSKSKKGGFLSILLIIVLVTAQMIATDKLREMYIMDQVDKYGVITHGEIVNLYTKLSKHSSKKFATVAYRYNGQVVYNDIDNRKKQIHMRDRVKLIYSSKDPNIFTVLKIDKPITDQVTDQAASSSQNKDLRGVPSPVTFIDRPPEFEGGMPALYAYLSENVAYPQAAKDQRIAGKVFISFVIAADGSVHDVKLEKGIGGGCDEAAIEAVQNMPNWKPGIQNGKPVRVKYNIPISFSL